jgi:peptidoglycan hydrolase-like protein with peptidoglycan-binding domain
MRSKWFMSATLIALISGRMASVIAVPPASKPSTRPSTTKPVEAETFLSDRQKSLLLQLSDAEANIKALNVALARTGYRVGQAYNQINSSEKGNEMLDRKGGGPVGWQDFYGKTARDFVMHDKDCPVYHQVQRPKQFDFIYRANDQQASKARQQVAGLGQDQTTLLARRQKHEADQSSLWATLAWERVKDREVAYRPLYRFKLKSEVKAHDPRIDVMRALILMLRTADQSALQGLEGVEADQAATFVDLNQRMKAAYGMVQESLANALPAADIIPEDRKEAEALKGLCKQLAEQSTIIADNHRKALDSDRAREDSSKLEFRSQLQGSLARFSATIAELDDRLGTTAAEWGLTAEVRVESSDKLPERHPAAGRPNSVAPATPVKQSVAEDAGVAGRIDLLKLFDPKRDIVSGRWIMKEGALTCAPGKEARVEFAVTPPEEYDYRLIFTRTGGTDAIEPICWAAGRQFGVTVGGWENTVIGIQMINGRGANGNRTTKKAARWLVNGQRTTLLVKVRKIGVEVWLDNKLVTDCKTNYSDVGLPPTKKLSRPDTLGLMVYDSTAVVESAEIIAVTGEGKRLRAAIAAPESDAQPGSAAAAAAGRPTAQVITAREEFPPATLIGGSWKVDGDELIQNSTEKNTGIVFGDPSWSSYNVKLKAKILDGPEGFKVRFHCANPENYRCFSTGTYANAWNEVAFVKDGKWGRNDGKAARGSVEKNRWYDVRIQVRGARCVCFLDGDKLFEDTNDQLTQGRVAIGSFQTVVSFRDIVVTSEDEKLVLWKGNPEIPH